MSVSGEGRESGEGRLEDCGGGGRQEHEGASKLDKDSRRQSNPGRITSHQHYDPTSRDQIDCNAGSGMLENSNARITPNRQTRVQSEREDEIVAASPSPNIGNSGNKQQQNVIGSEGLAGDIAQCEDVTSIQPGSNVTRVYKKCASNGSLAVYVGTRTLTVNGSHLEPLKGVLVLDQDSLIQNVSNDFRVWGQITLTFRYGREDEEVLGLRFCNEAILALKQLWPPLTKEPDELDDEDDELTPLQTVLLERVRSSASTDSIKSVPFVLCGGPVGLGSFPPPPSVLLAPAKPYRGSPIGTIYDLRIYASERPEERPPRRNLIRLALRAVQMPCIHVPFELKGSLEARPTILSRGKIRLSCELNKNAVRYGEPLEIKVVIQNNSRSSIRRVLVSLVQQVDVCMFTSGKFKNAVGCADDTVVIVPGASIQKRYVLNPMRVPARQWLALEEAFGRDPVLAPSTIIENVHGSKVILPTPSAGTGNARNVFAIIVSYYVKVKLVLGGLSLGQCVKVPFVLLPPENADPDPYPDPVSGRIPSEIPEENLVGRRISNAVGITSGILAEGSSIPSATGDNVVCGQGTAILAHVTNEARGNRSRTEDDDKGEESSGTGGGGGSTGGRLGIGSESGMNLRETLVTTPSPARMISQTPMTGSESAVELLPRQMSSTTVSGEAQGKDKSS